MFESVTPNPSPSPISVEPFPELEWDGEASQEEVQAKAPVLETPIPSPRQIVERELAKMSDFPEDEEKSAPSPDKPTKPAKAKPAGKRRRLSAFFSS